MNGLAEPLFAEEENAEERRFKEKGKDSFHGERLADDPAGVSGELGPVCTELKFHGNARDDSHGEIDSEDLSPESGRVVEAFVPRPAVPPLQKNDEKSEPHRQLGEKVVVRNGEGELEAVD